jgi:hypothetical protein
MFQTMFRRGAALAALSLAILLCATGGCDRRTAKAATVQEADRKNSQVVTPEVANVLAHSATETKNTSYTDSSAVEGQGWGTVKGQIVFGGDKIPDNPPANVDKDKDACLSKGPILKNDLIVNKKNKGIRWALVWLTDENDAKSTKEIPTHPSLKKIAPKVEIDQPCCEFEPRVMGIQEGQDLVIKNSMSIAHNTYMNGGLLGPNINPLIPAKGDYVVAKEKLKARYMPLLYTCSIHGWMRGYLGIFKHPYFVVTDADGNFTLKNAPAGKYRLMVWHEQGWVINGPSPDKRGRVIDIKANGTTNVGKISFVPAKDD